MARLKFVRQSLVLVLALLWVPLTAHCRIANLPGLEFLRCAADTATHHEDGQASGDDCTCCAQEHSEYSAARGQNGAPPRPLDLLVAIEPWISQPVLVPDWSAGVRTPAPPPPAPPVTLWVFDLRLALPVRAPSSAS